MKSQNLFYKTGNMGIDAFLILLKSKPSFILRELSVYLVFLGMNSMALFTSVLAGDHTAFLGSLGGLAIIGVLLSIKVKGLYVTAGNIFNKLSMWNDQEQKESMERDLQYFDLLFSSKYGKKIKIKFEVD